MSYNGSKSKGGAGWKLNVNTGTASTPTWTPVGERVDWKPASKWDKDDVTNGDATARRLDLSYSLAPSRDQAVECPGAAMPRPRVVSASGD